MPYTILTGIFCVVFWLARLAAASGYIRIPEAISPGMSVEYRTEDDESVADTAEGIAYTTDEPAQSEDISDEDASVDGADSGIETDDAAELATVTGDGGVKGETYDVDAGADAEEASDENENEDIAEESLSTDFVRVEDGYFDDALFIGDSRMVGIYDYSGWEDATFLCDNGYSIYGFGHDRQVVCQNTGSRTTPQETLESGTYGKVYIMLGTNDCPYGDRDSFAENYGSLIQMVRDLQPEAVIYLISNLGMSRDGESGNSSRGFTNQRMGALNDIIAGFADDTTIFYLDINSEFTDDEGYLPAEDTFDGFHLYARHYMELADFLKCHAVEYSAGEYISE